MDRSEHLRQINIFGVTLQQERFSDAVCKELGNYVYRLIDPRNGETFYVGKGKNNRVFDHIRAIPELGDDEDISSVKLLRIHEIRRAGLEVLHIIHRHGIPSEAIFEVEATLIDAYAGLSNIAGGQGSTDRGPMHAKEIIDKFDLPVIDQDPIHKLVLINVNKFEGSSREELYHQVRFSWRINRSRAQKADYVLAVARGIILGAFEVDYWRPATKDNFPDITRDDPNRSAFSGRIAADEIWDHYVGERGKRLGLDTLRHVQNPIRYWLV